jgi:hypothetical protein
MLVLQLLLAEGGTRGGEQAVVKLFPASSCLLGMIGPSSIRMEDGRGGLVAGLFFYYLIQPAILLDCLLLPVAFFSLIFKIRSRSKS